MKIIVYHTPKANQTVVLEGALWMTNNDGNKVFTLGSIKRLDELTMVLKCEVLLAT